MAEGLSPAILMDESRLIAAAQNGDLPAFNQLVLRYQNLAYNVAYRILGDPDRAADATQDSFIKAYKAMGSFHGSDFKPWLLRIVTNTCYDYLRAAKRKPTNSLDDELEKGDYNPRFHDPGEGPSEYIERKELSTLIQWGISQLNDHQRAVIVLVDIQGLSYEEAAEILNISLGTVKSRLSRARARLRDILQEHQELLPEKYRFPIRESTTTLSK
jgi:RNA polymerase sigma-70 factor (ECF subfamily)